VIRDHDREDTLFYMDPPYVMSSRRSTRHEYRHEMSDADHRDLAGVLRSVSGMVVLSGYHSDIYRELYGDWFTVERPHRADGARKDD
jgi:DNA adenine methylase